MTKRKGNSIAINPNIIHYSLREIFNFSGKSCRMKNRKTFFEQEN